MLRVTADSNIYISALNFGGTPDKVLNLARAGGISLVVSPAILDEVGRVLGDKFGWAQDAILQAREQISGFAERVEPDSRVEAVPDDPADNRILECATAGKCDYIVSGDKHLLKLGEFGAVRIVRAADFLEILGQAAERNRP